uniref:Uncharacterized protein n=1 Tax=Trichoplusia ni single nucleopolyhedrovirus TaxID=332054 RepID=A0A481V8M7_9ABAC|nr:hypothetical protein [Trichoplusia ni single nucleopolyhedrovirus]
MPRLKKIKKQTTLNINHGILKYFKIIIKSSNEDQIKDKKTEIDSCHINSNNAVNDNDKSNTDNNKSLPKENGNAIYIFCDRKMLNSSAIIGMKRPACIIEDSDDSSDDDQEVFVCTTRPIKKPANFKKIKEELQSVLHYIIEDH